jgi:hypothetical protein
MKLPVLLICLLAVAVQANAQFGKAEMGLGYTYTAPLATMKQNIKQGNGINLNFYFIPEKNQRFAYGFDINYTVYGHDKSRQQYEFSDGTTARMDVIVNNSFLNLMAGARYFVFDPTERRVKPYVTVKAGYSFFTTNLNIYDPDDNDHCEPVDTDILMKDGTFVASGGVGFQWDLNSIFKGLASNQFLFNAGANLTLGGRVTYMNTDPPKHNSNPMTDVNAQFINTQTQVVHEHHVGYVYSSYVEMVEIRGGFAYRIGQ